MNLEELWQQPLKQSESQKKRARKRKDDIRKKTDQGTRLAARELARRETSPPCPSCGRDIGTFATLAVPKDTLTSVENHRLHARKICVLLRKYGPATTLMLAGRLDVRTGHRERINELLDAGLVKRLTVTDKQGNHLWAITPGGIAALDALEANR
jgi:hypothetical protein